MLRYIFCIDIEFVVLFLKNKNKKHMLFCQTMDTKWKRIIVVNSYIFCIIDKIMMI